MREIGTTKNFWKKMGADAQLNREWPAGPSPESPQKGKLKKHFSGIEMVNPDAYGAKADSESLFLDFLEDLKKVLFSINFKKPFALATMPELINARVVKMNIIMDCKYVQDRLYFSYHYGQHKFGFYYIDKETLESIIFSN